MWTQLIFVVKCTTVTIQPSGPVVLPVGKSATITCTLESGIVGWNIIFDNMDPIAATPDNSPLPGVTVVELSGLSILTLNTSNTSITSVTCVATLLSNQMTFSKKINVIIYGE